MDIETFVFIEAVEKVDSETMRMIRNRAPMHIDKNSEVWQQLRRDAIQIKRQEFLAYIKNEANKL